MSDLVLAECHVLLVEDEFVIARSLSLALEDAGATILGPAATTERALRLLEGTDRVDAAVLDVNLRGETVYAVADALLARAVPFVFTTGYTASVIPPRYLGVDVLQKPLPAADMVRAVIALTRRGGSSSSGSVLVT
jgi:DNA-binding response OmpR family regulator